MKKSHIFGIIIIAVAVMVIVSTAGDASTYVSFGEAQELAEKGNANMIHVVGALKKDEQGQPVGIQTSPDMLSFSFIMVDQDNLEQEVIYNQPMPMDFLRSEQVVVVGSYKKNKFIADKILMKCPSKYQENEIKVGEVR
ncbi:MULTISPECIES: cytochrome c maturation protein CcmE [unclassified Imperialibacter]|uniref:cytochrome c maturation protein CcmE domain-containing protein n=1 Tax=unclassified Imperialibacter TaxID=2629706 RepID=UPI00125504C3|nr:MULTISPECIES: cytochrome c maturation protein CcmE [unclassified Imperialibacter]CAD5268333.1 Cytochrome c-type biogenesis protein CcmE [Imperialibacter sp. 89]CAD5296859.1 Cytochrome c-type biogenesis protein CcmE [Imperialibacter sp. 75]VVT33922.1 Cytochrome C biogenesis protein [Imperialibacter sp. EC-SDR9]